MDPSDSLHDLKSGTPDQQTRAAKVLYQQHIPDKPLAPAIEQALRQRLTSRPSAPALLLMAYATKAESLEALLKLRRQTEATPYAVKLQDWMPPVDASLPIMVALSRLGDHANRLALLSAIEKASPDELYFLLSAIREIDSPEVLHALARRSFADLHEIPGAGVPFGATPTLRVCDLAAQAFVRRLSLKPSVAVEESRRCTDSQLVEIQRLIKSSLPQ